MNRNEYIFQSHQLSTSYDFWKKRNFDFSKILLRDLGTQNNHVHLQNENTRFSSDFMFTKWQKHVFQAVSCYKMKKQAFEVFFTFTKRKHDLIWSDFMLMKWKNTLLKRFSCLQHKKHVFEALFMFTKWKKDLKRFVFFMFTKRKSRFWSVFHVYKMEKHLFEAIFISTKWKNICFEEFYLQNDKNMFLKRVTSLQNEKNRILKRFSCLQIKNATFWSFLMYIKWKNSFLKKFSSLQNEKACFEAFCLQNLKNMFLKRFTSLQNEKPRFGSDFHVYKMRKTRFRSVFHLYKMKKHDSEALFMSKWKKRRFRV